MAPLEELERAFERYRRDRRFREELRDLLTTYGGRPTPITEAPRLAASAGGARIVLKREDLLHTGAHKLNNCLGQVLLARRMGKTRVVAETGAGQHGVATAASAARLGLPCVVYMGAVDMERQSPNVSRMRLLGAEVVPVDSGSRTSEGRDQRSDARLDRKRRDDALRPRDRRSGPHPYPAMVRHFQSVIGREARAQFRRLAGRDPHAAVACVGGGSNAIGLFSAYLDSPVAAVRRRGGRPGPTARRPRGAVRRRFRGRPPRHADDAAAGRRRTGPADALGVGGARLPGGRPRARVPRIDRPRALRARLRPTGARCVSTPRADRGNPARARERPRDRVRRAPRSHDDAEVLDPRESLRARRQGSRDRRERGSGDGDAGSPPLSRGRPARGGPRSSAISLRAIPSRAAPSRSRGPSIAPGWTSSSWASPSPIRSPTVRCSSGRRPGRSRRARPWTRCWRIARRDPTGERDRARPLLLPEPAPAARARAFGDRGKGRRVRRRSLDRPPARGGGGDPADPSRGGPRDGLPRLPDVIARADERAPPGCRAASSTSSRGRGRPARATRSRRAFERPSRERAARLPRPTPDRRRFRHFDSRRRSRRRPARRRRRRRVRSRRRRASARARPRSGASRGSWRAPVDARTRGTPSESRRRWERKDSFSRSCAGWI